MLSISYEGFDAIVTEYLEGNVGDDTVILHIAFAADTATAANAIWAALNNANNRKQDSGIKLKNSGGTTKSVHLSRRTSQGYRSDRRSFCDGDQCTATFKTTPFRCPDCGKKLRGRPLVTQHALTSPELLTANDKQGEDIYLIDVENDGMPADFYPRLKAITGIPMKPEWAEWLWQEGQKETPREFCKERYGETAQIEQQDSYGITAWLVRANRDAWLNIIRCHLGLSVKLEYDGNRTYANGRHALIRTKETWRYAWTLHTRDENGEWAVIKNDDDKIMVREEELETAIVKAGKALNVRFEISEVKHG